MSRQTFFGAEEVGLEEHRRVLIYNHHPIDDIEPLPEPTPNRTTQLRQACLQWHCGYREGSLADIANEFGVSRAIVSRYARQIAEHCGIPAARSDATAERCRVAQVTRSGGKKNAPPITLGGAEPNINRKEA